MHGPVVIGHVSIVGVLVQRLLLFLHVAQTLYIIGIAQGQAVLGVGKVMQNKLTVLLGTRGLAHAHIHQIQVIIHIQAIDIVGIVLEQTVKSRFRSREILHFILQYHTDVVQSFLDNIICVLLLFGRERNLFHVILGIMRVVGALHLLALLLCHLVFVRLGGRRISIGRLRRGRLRAEIIHIERCLVAAAPVVLQLTRAPAALELLTSGVTCLCIIEIPRVVSVDIVLLRRLVVLVHLRLVLRFVGLVLLASGRLGLLYFLFRKLANYGIYHLGPFKGIHGGKPQQRILQVHVLRVHRQLVKDIAAALQHRQIREVVRQQRHALRIARLSQLILPAVIIQTA